MGRESSSLLESLSSFVPRVVEARGRGLPGRGWGTGTLPELLDAPS